MPDEKSLGSLRDILDSGKMIRVYLRGVSRESFMADTEKQDAVLRRFEIMREAASRVSPEVQSLLPSVPFRSMKGMRNIIAHDYGAVDLDQVWQTASADLEPLIATLENCFDRAG